MSAKKLPLWLLAASLAWGPLGCPTPDDDFPETELTASLSPTGGSIDLTDTPTATALDVTGNPHDTPTLTGSQTPRDPTPTGATPTSPGGTAPTGLTPSATPSDGGTPQVTPTQGGTPRITPTQGGTPRITPTQGGTPPVTPTEGLTPRPTPTDGLTPRPTPTDAGTPLPTPTDAGTPPLVTPPAGGCTVGESCEAGCPLDAIGCECVEDDLGDDFCVPVCLTAEDCPDSPSGAPPICTEDGICEPGEPIEGTPTPDGTPPDPPGTPGGNGGNGCQDPEDCEDRCPDGSVGCTCLVFEDGGDGFCVPTCEETADCPDNGEGPVLLCGDDGICAPEGGGPDTPPPDGTPPEPPGTPGGNGGNGCQDPEDCADRCPDGSVGCTCLVFEDGGDGFCVPTCEETADCPDNGEGPVLLCGDDGICAPEGGGPETPPPDGTPPEPPGTPGGNGGNGCQDPEDCADRCPDGSVGCTCLVFDDGGDGFCVPTCEETADCPDNGEGPVLLCGDDGICAPEGGGPETPPPDGTPPAPPGTPGDNGGGGDSCSGPEDCVDACPAGSVGCTCLSSDTGGGFCVPTCEETADCPDNGGGPALVCGDDGLCAPEGGGPETPPPDGTPPAPPGTPGDNGGGGDSCSGPEDCVDACPAGSVGCTCLGSDTGGGFCVPTCEETADCPDNGGGPALVCGDDGLCAPEGGGPETPPPDGTPPAPPGTPGDNGGGGDSCSGPEDCVDACPAGSVGCTCLGSDTGGGFCVPTCEETADCPDNGGGPALVCGDDGLCAPEGGGPETPPPDGTPPAPPGTPGDNGGGGDSCSGPEDCVDACPSGSVGCTCLGSDTGGGFCVPTCEETADCPDNGGGPALICGDDGLCAPEGGGPETPPPDGTPPAPPGTPGAPGGNDSCTGPEDCVSACPAGSVGCTCLTSDTGSGFCVPTCEETADCPDNGGGPALICGDDGLCAPEGGGPTPPP